MIKRHIPLKPFWYISLEDGAVDTAQMSDEEIRDYYANPSRQKLLKIKAGETPTLWLVSPLTTSQINECRESALAALEMSNTVINHRIYKQQCFAAFKLCVKAVRSFAEEGDKPELAVVFRETDYEVACEIGRVALELSSSRYTPIEWFPEEAPVEPGKFWLHACSIVSESLPEESSDSDATTA